MNPAVTTLLVSVYFSFATEALATNVPVYIYSLSVAVAMFVCDTFK